MDQEPGHNTPPRTWSQRPLPPGPGHNTPSPRDLVTTPPPPRTWSQHPPPPHPRTWSQHPLPCPLGPGHNTPPPPRDYAQVGGTHPTGMHSFENMFLFILAPGNFEKHHSNSLLEIVNFKKNTRDSFPDLIYFTKFTNKM